MQIYSGHLERKFVPVEKRGGGDANVDNDVPAHLRNDFPHSGHTNAKTTNNGRGGWTTYHPACQSFSLSRVTSHLAILLLHGAHKYFFMQERYPTVAWQPHPSLFQQKLVLIDDVRLTDSDHHLLTTDPLGCCFDPSVSYCVLCS